MGQQDLTECHPSSCTDPAVALFFHVILSDDFSYSFTFISKKMFLPLLILITFHRFWHFKDFAIKLFRVP